MRLVDADVLEQDVYHIGYKPIIEWKDVQKQSTIDAVPVVRCKDCKWKLWTHCTRFENAPVTDEDYCSRAERRTDETD